MPHSIAIRVYYEDTDLAGIVYYANYLKFIERARSEWVRALGIDQAQMHAQGAGVFVVRRVVADYRAPARFDDVLDVTTEHLSHSGARLEMRQCVLRAGKLLFEAQVTLVCLAPSGRPQPLPKGLLAALCKNITI